MPPTPTTIGPYVVERALGRGGMGVVYACRHPALPRPVAVKQNAYVVRPGTSAPRILASLTSAVAADDDVLFEGTSTYRDGRIHHGQLQQEVVREGRQVCVITWRIARAQP